MAIESPIRLGFFAHAMLWIAIIAIVLSIFLTFYQTKNVSQTISTAGKEFLNPLAHIQESSSKIISNGGISINASNVPSFLQVIYSYWGFLSEIDILFIWIILLSKIWGFLIGNSTNFLASYSLAIFSYFGILIVYLASTGQSVLSPINAVSSLIQATPYITQPIVDLAHKIGV